MEIRVVIEVVFMLVCILVCVSANERTRRASQYYKRLGYKHFPGFGKRTYEPVPNTKRVPYRPDPYRSVDYDDRIDSGYISNLPDDVDDTSENGLTDFITNRHRYHSFRGIQDQGQQRDLLNRDQLRDQFNRGQLTKDTFRDQLSDQGEEGQFGDQELDSEDWNTMLPWYKFLNRIQEYRNENRQLYR